MSRAHRIHDSIVAIIAFMKRMTVGIDDFAPINIKHGVVVTPHAAPIFRSLKIVQMTMSASWAEQLAKCGPLKHIMVGIISASQHDDKRILLNKAKFRRERALIWAQVIVAASLRADIKTSAHLPKLMLRDVMACISLFRSMARRRRLFSPRRQRISLIWSCSRRHYAAPPSSLFRISLSRRHAHATLFRAEEADDISLR